ncbi:MAG: site-2 protease family protein [Clostridia bacterium]|nr:site-2 protease family protein [Clostridia bacterium]
MALLGSVQSVFSTIGYIIVALLTLMVMIVIHEFGHYVVGKILKFKINEFAIGFGPPILRFMMKSGEYFSIRPIPLGGFCAFEGEDGESAVEGSFNSMAPWKRILVLIAGVTFNIISAFLVMGIVFSAYGYALPQVRSLYESTDPAYVHTLKENDVIIKLDGKNVYSLVDFNIGSIISKADKEEIPAVIYRDGEVIEVTVRPGEFKYPVYADDAYNEDGSLKEDAVPTEYSTYSGLGIVSQVYFYKFDFFTSLWRGIVYCGQIIVFLFQTIGGLFTGAVAVKGALGGPITTVSVIASSISISGFRGVLTLLGMMSANVAIFNILPLPALDGSKVLFVIIEWIRGKPINRKVEAIISTVGLILLFSMTIIFDIVNLGWIASLF